MRWKENGNVILEKDWYKKTVLAYSCEKATHISAPEKYEITKEFILNQFNPKDNITIADFGGVTWSYNYFKISFPNSTIYSINMVKEHIDRVANPIVTNVLKTPLKSNFIDLVFSGDTIEHIIDTDRFIEEVYRVLKPNGYLILSTPNLSDWLNRIFLFLGLPPHNYNPSANKLGNPFFNGQGVWHKSVFTFNGLKQFLESHKFRILKSKGYTYVSDETRLKMKLKKTRKFLNHILPQSWREGICILAQKVRQ